MVVTVTATLGFFCHLMTQMTQDPKGQALTWRWLSAHRRCHGKSGWVCPEAGRGLGDGGLADCWGWG